MRQVPLPRRGHRQGGRRYLPPRVMEAHHEGCHGLTSSHPPQRPMNFFWLYPHFTDEETELREG
jgi:hypothetical protein